MKILDFFRHSNASEVQSRPRAEDSQGHQFSGLDDPALLEYIRGGTTAGVDTARDRSLRNMAVLRCVTLISESIGMLPVNLQSSDDKKQVQSDNPAHRLLKYKPNDW